MNEHINERIKRLNKKLDILYAYQEDLIEDRTDDHGVADAAMDIREIKARLDELDIIKGK